MSMMRSNQCSGSSAATESKSPVFEIPLSWGPAIVQRGIAFGRPWRIGAQLDRGQVAALAHGVQQVHAHRARAGTGLKHAHAGADVAELNNLGDVLRYMI